MTDTTARFALPLLQPGQAQKELYHNEALALLDGAVAPAVLTVGDNTPPGSPAPGQCWIVGGAPSGAWAGNARRIALWTASGWRFVAPVPGMLAWIVPDAVWAWYDGITWTQGVLPTSGVRVGGQQVLGARQPAIPGPSGGTTIDAEARAAVASILVALRNHGLVSV